MKTTKNTKATKFVDQGLMPRVTLVPLPIFVIFVPFVVHTEVVNA